MKLPMIDVELINPDCTPVRGSVGAAGYDFRANITEPVVIPAGGDVLLPLGVAFEIPLGTALYMWPRSGMDAKHKIGKHAGLIDSDYRGEIHAALHNRGSEDYVVQPLDRVVQGVFGPYYVFEFNVVDRLDDSDRGAGGFGSTGR